MDYYIAGYYLLRLRHYPFGNSSFKNVYSCSICANDSLLFRFGRYWDDNLEENEIAQKKYKITPETIQQIYAWTAKMEKNKQIEKGYQFYNLKVAVEYRNRFFSHLKDVVLLGLYLPIEQAEKLIAEFEYECSNENEIGIVHKLKCRELESDNGKVLGYDLIGLDWRTFHCLHCNNIYPSLRKEFGIVINNYGLIDTEDEWRELVDYMNDVDSKVEPVSWYFAKIKSIDIGIKAYA